MGRRFAWYRFRNASISRCFSGSSSSRRFRRSSMDMAESGGLAGLAVDVAAAAAAAADGAAAAAPPASASLSAKYCMNAGCAGDPPPPALTVPSLWTIVPEGPSLTTMVPEDPSFTTIVPVSGSFTIIVPLPAAFTTMVPESSPPAPPKTTVPASPTAAKACDPERDCATTVSAASIVDVVVSWPLSAASRNCGFSIIVATSSTSSASTLDGSPALITKGCFARTAACARCCGSLTRQRSMKLRKSSDHSSGTLSFGGGLVGIINMARIGCTSECGGDPSAISMAVMPSDHRSARMS
mmetsp:Transcript_31301/g.82041  ORF Transcript_31301/g.82041 Transcript_31301/m.82041 type:complete len:297 (-) Transcript_31301:646-1536(-)